MSTINYGRVREALLKKQQVVAEYNGHIRELCPHVIGRKNGREQALFYQLPIPLISPLDSGGIRHPVPIQSAMVFRLNPPPLVGA